MAVENDLNFGVGRPKAELDRQVADALINATVTLLKDKPRNEITVREIAHAAGVNKAMIGYYFNNKDSLFVALLEDLTHELLAAFLRVEKELEQVDPAITNPTRTLITTTSRIYAKHASGLRLQLMEIQFNSELKRVYLERLASRPTKVLQRIIKKLVDRGIYRKDLDPAYTALSMEWMLCHGVMTESVMEPVFKLKPGPRGDDDWVEYMIGLFDQGMRTPRAPHCL